MSGANHRKCCCGGSVSGTCCGSTLGRCCYGSDSVATITLTIDGVGPVTATVPFSGCGSGIYSWKQPLVEQGADSGESGYWVEHNDGTQDYRPSWTIYIFTSNGDGSSSEDDLKLTYDAGDEPSYNPSPKCCGMSGSGTSRGGKAVSFTITISNNPCCSVLRAGEFVSTCVKLSHNLTCPTDTVCDQRCTECCSTYEVNLTIGGTPTTFTLAQQSSNVSGFTGTACEWSYTSGSTSVTLAGQIISYTGDGTHFFNYLTTTAWDGCPPEDGWAFSSKTIGAGTPPTLTSVTKMDCPEEGI